MSYGKGNHAGTSLLICGVPITTLSFSLLGRVGYRRRYETHFQRKIG